MKEICLKHILLILLSGILLSCKNTTEERINRFALVSRNNPVIVKVDSLSSLSVGNGNFAFTVDATGLQSFPGAYRNGVPLGTQSQWGWHSFPNPKNYAFEETLKAYNFRGKEEWYAVQFKEGRAADAANWFRANPHRLHLGYIGMEMIKADGTTVLSQDMKGIHQQLNLWNGTIDSRFMVDTDSVCVKTACHPFKDQIKATVYSDLLGQNRLKINFRFPYPSGKHSDDASDWTVPENHVSRIMDRGENYCVLERIIDATSYYQTVEWEGETRLEQKNTHYFTLSTTAKELSFTCRFSSEYPERIEENKENVFDLSAKYWASFWQNGGAVDFSECTDPEATELERRVVLSQYLMAIQCAGDLPPQETGLTCNSWFGKFHLEMHWWHGVHFALWNRIDLLERSLDWYVKAYDNARSIAQRQGFDGVRWMKMTDPSATEAPSGVGSFLIWQQPHIIYFAELIYRNNPNSEVLLKYKDLVDATATFMFSFADYDQQKDRYILQGIIPAQESLRASETINPPFEVAYWHFAMGIAQKWRERNGEKRMAQWDDLISKLAPLASKDGLYLASEDAVHTYEDIRLISDHPAVLGAWGILPESDLVREDYMKNTLHWIINNWNWNKTWGWDYPMVAMCAARIGEPQMAIDALLMKQRTNTYLVNGHNYQDERLRVYLPGNGGLLSAVSMMCIGWDGNTTDTPGFPKDGKWDVKWEDLKVMP